MPVRRKALALALAAVGAACHRPPDGVPQPVAAAGAAAPDPLDAALEDGDRAFASRGDPARLEAALQAYRRAAAQRAGDPQVELRLARAEAFRALASDSTASKDAWDASARAAERALRRAAPGWARAVDQGEDPAAAAARVDASGAEPLYWLALGTMRAAQTTGYAAVLAVKDAALAMMARAAELDERIDAAGPHRALGAWRAALPTAAGGGAAASLAHFDRAHALFPDEQLSRVLEAETYAVLVQDERLFDRLLAEVTSFDLAKDAARAPENAIAKRRANALAAKKARLF